MALLQLVTIIVDEYDPAISFFVDVLGFELAEDSPSLTGDGRPKRWVVVRPPGAQSDRRQLWGTRPRVGWVSFFASTTSKLSTTAWWPPEWSS